jgi:hypothetical protein
VDFPQVQVCPVVVRSQRVERWRAQVVQLGESMRLEGQTRCADVQAGGTGFAPGLGPGLARLGTALSAGRARGCTRSAAPLAESPTCTQLPRLFRCLGSGV